MLTRLLHKEKKYIILLGGKKNLDINTKLL